MCGGVHDATTVLALPRQHQTDQDEGAPLQGAPSRQDARPSRGGLGRGPRIPQALAPLPHLRLQAVRVAGAGREDQHGHVPGQCQVQHSQAQADSTADLTCQENRPTARHLCWYVPGQPDCSHSRSNQSWVINFFWIFGFVVLATTACTEV